MGNVQRAIGNKQWAFDKKNPCSPCHPWPKFILTGSLNKNCANGKLITPASAIFDRHVRDNYPAEDIRF